MVTTLTGGIESLNGLIAAQQYLSTGTQFNTLGWTTIGTATNNVIFRNADKLR